MTTPGFLSVHSAFKPILGGPIPKILRIHRNPNKLSLLPSAFSDLLELLIEVLPQTKKKDLTLPLHPDG